jgi:hypothetical protein
MLMCTMCRCIFVFTQLLFGGGYRTLLLSRIQYYQPLLTIIMIVAICWLCTHSVQVYSFCDYTVNVHPVVQLPASTIHSTAYHLLIQVAMISASTACNALSSKHHAVETSLDAKVGKFRRSY